MSLWGNLRQVVRYHGIGAGGQLLTLAAVRRAVVLERVHFFKLQRPGPELSSPPEHSLRLATEDELVALAAEGSWDLGNMTRSEICHLFAEGHRCVLNLVGDEIAGYGWMNPNALEVPKLRATFELFPTEVHLYKGFSPERFRGRRLGVERFVFWLHYLAPQGISTLVTDFAFDNPATLARVDKLGLQPIGSGTYVSRGRYGKLICTGAMAARPYRLHEDATE